MPDVTQPHDTSTSVTLARFFPTFKFAGEMVAHGVATVTTGVRHRYRRTAVALAATATSVTRTCRKRFVRVAAVSASLAVAVPRRRRRVVNAATAAGLAAPLVVAVRRVRRFSVPPGAAGATGIASFPARRIMRLNSARAWRSFGVCDTTRTSRRMRGGILLSDGTAMLTSSGDTLTADY